MQEQVQTTHPLGVLLQQRYIIEDLLGKGGFGAVYLVSDQESEGTLLALKELRDQDVSEKKRLHFECELLKRLDHPALPQLEGLFEENNRLYMLMEYIPGQNLEILRKQQARNVFTFAEMVALLQPVIEAVEYLHHQQPPLLHRDIKPANIVVSEDEKRCVLVDFGIAKEYHADATTTAVRRCSPGYSAPEQYSSMGTDPRVDIYALGATCYTLLAGVPPVDSLQRLTSVASRGVDPLVRIEELAPHILPGAAQALHIALALNYERRFATVQEFWQALTAQFDTETVVLPGRYEMAERGTDEAETPVSVHSVSRPARSTKVRVALALGLAVLSIVLVLSLWWRFPQASASYLSPLLPAKTLATTPAHTPDGAFPLLAPSYTGTLDNLLTSITTDITLVVNSQNSQSLRGIFTEKNAPEIRTFSGVMDTGRHILLTVSGGTGQSVLFLEGIIHPDNTLAGNYCSIDTAGQCSGGAYGLWSLVPSPQR